MSDYSWKPIEPLSEGDKRIDLAAIRPLYESWRALKDRLQQSSPTALQDFNRRLVRQLSVETGILERLYELDRGTTEALVTHGFIEDLISHSSTDVEPSRLVHILRDQEAAVELMMNCVARSRDLTKGVIHELHATLTRHQDTTSAVDQFGNRFDIPLLKGQFKEQPNNPKRRDGALHEYCPPLHVDAEMEKLLGWLSGYSAEDPIIVAAWLHHRFTQIHPYQDGNGRVARALTTLVLLRAELLHLVIDRDLRVKYIEALELADGGDLSALASLFAGLERKAILEASSVDPVSDIPHQKKVSSAVIQSIGDKLAKRHQSKVAELRRVNGVAQALRTQAREVLRVAFDELKRPVSEVAEPEIFLMDGDADHRNAHWYKSEVRQTAKEAAKFANFVEDHYFVRATFRVERERLVFVTSFHHIGRELTGIMEATAFSQLESLEDSEDRKFVSRDFFPCSAEPFVFTYNTNAQEIADSFARWLDSALAVALKEYGDRL